MTVTPTAITSSESLKQLVYTLASAARMAVEGKKRRACSAPTIPASLKKKKLGEAIPGRALCPKCRAPGRVCPEGDQMQVVVKPSKRNRI